MDFNSINQAYVYLQRELASCKEEKYQEVIDSLITSNIDTYKVLKHFIEDLKLNRYARMKLIDIICKEPITTIYLLNDCIITQEEREYILNIVFQKPEYSLLFRRYSKIMNEEEKYEALKCIIKNDEYFYTLVNKSIIRHFIKLDEKDKEIMIDAILNDSNIKIARAAYYSRYLDISEDNKEKICSLAIIQKMINN